MLSFCCLFRSKSSTKSQESILVLVAPVAYQVILEPDIGQFR